MADTQFLAGDFAGLNAMIRNQAVAAGATYVDVAASSTGHGTGQASSRRLAHPGGGPLAAPRHGTCTNG